MRLINPQGVMLGIYPIKQALAIAEELGLDLVELNPKADPPVCKIMDYGKYKYEKKKEAREARKKRKEIEVKEVKLTPKINEHDYMVKLKHIKRFLQEGNKAKITIEFRGREAIHPEGAVKVIERIIEDLKEEAFVEQPYKNDGRTLTMILAPK